MTARGHGAVVNRLGLHARPCTRLVEVANRFASVIAIEANGTRANAKSVLSLMSLAAPAGTDLEIEAEGADETEAVSALLAEIAAGFHE